jgi:hypothetical protein
LRQFLRRDQFQRTVLPLHHVLAKSGAAAVWGMNGANVENVTTLSPLPSQLVTGRNRLFHQ